MTYYNPPHEVRDEDKLQAMIDTLENGGSLPPVIVYGYDAYTGSHRIAAWLECDMDADTIELDDEEFMTARALAMGYDDLDFSDPDDVEFYHKYVCNTDITDFNEFCEALLKTSDNQDVINAVEDQI